MAGKELTYSFHHVFLPSKVPQVDDHTDRAGSRALFERLTLSSHQYQNLDSARHYTEWSTIHRTLTTFTALYSDNGSITANALITAFCDVIGGGILILHISAQNSGLIICKAGSDGYVVESFEASPVSAKVLAAKTALQWDFPSRAVVLPSSVFEDETFQECLAKFVEQASVESLKQFAAITHRAGSSAFESRDTSSPALVGQLLMAILEANGKHKIVKLTRKRVHDEVCWSDGSETPWRRSPAWLVLRVGLQRSLCFLLGDILGTIHYKFFMCFFMSQLCTEFCTQAVLSPDQLSFARTKLSRRIAKLHSLEKSEAPKTASTISRLFNIYETNFRHTLETVNGRLDEQWSSIRSRAIKKVLPLPKRCDEGDTILSLSNSRQKLWTILNTAYTRPKLKVHIEARRLDVDFSTWAGPDTFNSSDYLRLTGFETKLGLETPASIESETESGLDHICRDLRYKIRQYCDTACSAYKSDSEQLSLMVLLLMELWQLLDSAALQLYPLLAQYNPGFPDDILFTLKTTRLVDLQRIQNVEYYLENRRGKADPSCPSIFGNITPRSFCIRYYDQCQVMQELLTTIDTTDQVAKEEKKREWERMSTEYDHKMKQVHDMTCDCVNVYAGRHRSKICKKHILEQECMRMGIMIHEDALPADTIQARAAVFELLIPKGFVSWRDSTWQLLQLARKIPGSDAAPKAFFLLQDYISFRSYGNFTQRSISLASQSKSWLATHNKRVPFPTPLDHVCLKHRMKYQIFDTEKSVWTSKCVDKPSYATLCAPTLLPNSVFASIERCVRPNFDGKALNANEIVASQTSCPINLTIPEFIAFQDLRLGSRTQWIRLLRELASSNMNFGTVEVSTLVTQLALVTGPPEERSPLRAIHWVFRDTKFCTALAVQIKARLESVATNWREGPHISCLITILLRMLSLGAFESVKEAESLLLLARRTTHDWLKLLRKESFADIHTAHKRSRDALLAALLCHKTFMIEVEGRHDRLMRGALIIFLECSIAIRDNLSKESGYIAKLPAPLRQLYIHDIKLVHQLEAKLRLTMESLPDATTEAVNSVWVEATGALSRQFTPWTFLRYPQEGWITARSIAVNGTSEQVVHFDFLEGTLLIDGQPLGRLPDLYTKQEIFKQFFGHRIHSTYPSNLPGMSYRLASLVHEHEVHFGFRDRTCFMRARSGQNTLEFIPSAIFLANETHGGSDLPLSLIHNHVHWLDINSCTLQIRKRISMWRNVESSWKIDLRTYQASRKDSLLVRPDSLSFNRIAQIIEPFENRSNIIIHQPQNKNLRLRLPALELSFFVNFDGFLESRQLQAVIDGDQDAGTFYGLESKLILSDVRVPDDRSVIVAMGDAEIKPYVNHVKVFIEHADCYARFPINSVLGRLECPGEPRLRYFKSYCHAITAGLLPDPLTGRTGTAEAIHCLNAASSQPYAPLAAELYRILSSIADLTPRRVYYPESLKVLQKVVWNNNLASAVQHDDFRPIVEDIIQQCRILHRFHQIGDAPPAAYRESDKHLLSRARSRNRSFRPLQILETCSNASDSMYVARDCTKTIRANNAFEASLLLQRWSRDITVTHDLSGILQGWPTIQGYTHEFDPSLLSELIDINLADNWGSLFKYCQESPGYEDRYKLMFLFASISFNKEVDMNVIRSLIAVSIMSEFKALVAPQWPCFTYFRAGQIPTMEILVDLMSSCRIPYGEDERTLFPDALQFKQRRKLELAQREHEKKSEDNCKTFVNYLLLQWPCEEPSMDQSIGLPLLDSEKAYASVKPEWKRLFENYELSEHLKQAQSILDSCKPTKIPSITVRSDGDQEFYPVLPFCSIHFTIYDLLSNLVTRSQVFDQGVSIHMPTSRYLPKTALSMDKLVKPSPLIPRKRELNTQIKHQQTSRSNAEVILELQSIISRFSTCEDPTRRAYGNDLQYSLNALQRKATTVPNDAGSFDIESLTTNISLSQAEIHSRFDSIRYSALTQDTWWLEAGALLPDITTITLLETLRNLARVRNSPIPRDMIIAYGRLITDLQHLRRIRSMLRKNDIIQLADEIRHYSHVGWNITDHVDWLLLEIDFDFLIRPDQREVAEAMIAPSSGTNSVLQMNMGQGKSSVIIPMVVAELANVKNLVRVVVPRSLRLQMALLLQSRLGGLIGRKVKILSYSRKTSTDVDMTKAYCDLHQQMLESQGVILTLPEYMLSFQLSGLQQLLNGRLEQASLMMKLQSWFTQRCRDILDECDHMLDVKTQLIYPSGSQSLVDGHPNRWKVVQKILGLVKKHVGQLQRDFPRGVEVVNRNRGSYPTIYLLNDTVKDVLVHRLTESILNGEGAILPLNGCTPDETESINSFLRNAQFSKAAAAKSTAVFKDNADARQSLLLLRGLLIHRILPMGLNKRWNVQYGISPSRDPIAVPFSSKGIPSEQAEFGHPEVSIVLTTLSLYYSGLTLAQFQQSFNQLVKSDEPVQEFDRWIHKVTEFPESLRSWQSINIDDEVQCTQLWEYLRHQMTVINYFLNHFVFPRHARTFERKISASGWDLLTPLPDAYQVALKESLKAGRNSVKQSGSLTVGFSGTNDNKTLLPLNIRQNDLPRLSHTNAEVLTYLLEPRNRRYVPVSDKSGKRLSEKSFLYKLRENHIRILLDAGAQILELTNADLAMTWLQVDPLPDAAVYFGVDGRVWCRYRDGRVLPLAATPYLDNLGTCLVYLDEAHTRGVDLKMPANAVAALTLGIMQSKDHTVQGKLRRPLFTICLLIQANSCQLR